jgi:hypothetical protein
MRRLLIVASVLVFLAGFQLFILTEQTDQYFAWTIQPPLTAAFLGAGYWSSFLLEFLASRQRVWAKARIAVPAVFAFTTLTLVATLLHFDRFHFWSTALFAQTAAWFWLAIYLIVPPSMLFLWVRQMRVPGGDPQRQMTMPPSLRLILVLQSVFMLANGATLFVMPTAAPLLWPWKLTALTSRAVGAWFVGLGVFASHAAWENDFSRVKVGMVSYLFFGLLQLVAIGRFPSVLEWSQPIAWAYLLLAVTILAVGAYGTFSSRSRSFAT